METNDNPEVNPDDIKLFVNCGECDEDIILKSTNTIIFECSDEQFYYYTKCPNECEPITDVIEPEYIHYFNYFEHWYDKDGNKITDLRISYILDGTLVEVEYVPTWDETLLVQIQQADYPFEYANDSELKRWK
jgi:hypothetical protein